MAPAAFAVSIAWATAGISWSSSRANAARYIVEKGSITVDGISLTVAALVDDTAFSIAIIPHTLDNTNLKAVKPGDRANLEYDVIAKYVENMVKPYAIRND